MLEVAVLKSKIETDLAFNEDVWEMDVTIGCIGYGEKGSETCFIRMCVSSCAQELHHTAAIRITFVK